GPGARRGAPGSGVGGQGLGLGPAGPGPRGGHGGASMRLMRSRRTQPGETAVGLTGVVRKDRRTKNLVERLRPGDVAVIDHVDIDRVAAETLVECRPVAVVNAATSISGEYPHAGPMVLVEAGIPLLDAVGGDVFALVREGARGRTQPAAGGVPR